MTSAIDRVAELVRRETGIRVHGAQYPALASAIGRAFPEGGAAAVLEAAARPGESEQAIARLIDEVTIKETSFFRERRQLDAIDWPGLLANARAHGAGEIRVWCAACATGEEAYSLALLACEAFGSRQPPVRILATDVSGAALAAARAGRYRERSLRAVPGPLRERYFEPGGGAFVVGGALRGVVAHARHNLVAEPAPPPGETQFDLIVCRNVLIYFDGDTADEVVARLRNAIRPGGALILGSADALSGAGPIADSRRRRSP